MDRSTIKLTRVALADLVPLQRGLRQATVDAKRELIREGEPVDAPLVFRASDVLYVGDGHHTCEACHLEGLRHVKVRIIDVGDIELGKLLKIKLGKPGDDDLIADPFRQENRKADRALKKETAAVLRRLGQSIADQITIILEQSGLSKADKPEDTPPPAGAIPPVGSAAYDAWMAGWIDELMMDELLELNTPLYDGVSKIAKSANKKILAEFMPDDYKSLVNVVNERAVDYARERAGELIGKNARGTGELAETTRKRIRASITDGLSENIGRDGIVQNLVDDFAFSEQRAELIANTEIANANSEGTMQGYRQAEDAGLEVLKGWLCEPDACEICLANQEAGWIPLDETYPSGHERTPAHPNCRCSDVGKVVEPVVKFQLLKSFQHKSLPCNAAHEEHSGDGKQRDHHHV